MAKSAASQFDTIYDPVTPIAGLTPSYASLEQWTGEPPDPRDDIYSFALVVYELLSGHHPFASVSSKKAFESGLTPQRLDGLSRVQWDALRNGLALQREQRTKTIKEMLRSLAPPTFFRRYRALILVGGSVTSAILIGFAIHFLYNWMLHGMLGGGNHGPRPPVILTTDQQQEVKESLFLAQDSLKDVKPSDSPQDLAYALSEGANNVNQILDSVLKLDPGNEAAQTMKARIVELYLGKAQELYDQHQYPEALTLVRFGRKAVSDDTNLFKLQQDICDHDPAACAAPAN
jgi:serine/threonine protein kinase